VDDVVAQVDEAARPHRTGGERQVRAPVQERAQDVPGVQVGRAGIDDERRAHPTSAEPARELSVMAR
jgi:hypothetical protein